MKKSRTRILALVFVLMLISTNITSLADYHEFLRNGNRPPIDNGISTFGNSAPSTVHDFANGTYTASWNSVTSYTYTGKLFVAGESKSIKLNLDVIMNEYGETGHFYVYLCTSDGTAVQTVLNSGATPKHSYKKSTTISVASATRKYCFKIVVKENSGNSCSGDLRISQ